MGEGEAEGERASAPPSCAPGGRSRSRRVLVPPAGFSIPSKGCVSQPAISFLTDALLKVHLLKKKCTSQKKLNANVGATVCTRVLDSDMIRLPTAPPQPFRTAGDVQRTKDSVKRRVCGTQEFTLLLRFLIYLAELYFLPMSC